MLLPMPEELPRHRMKDMIAAGKFYSREEAEELKAVSEEAGIPALIIDPRKQPGAFDATLGGFTASLTFTVYVHQDAAEALSSRLENILELDPADPLCSLSVPELLALTQGPVDGNLAERVLARKALAARPDHSASLPVPSPGAKDDQEPPNDPHATADARRAWWFGAAALVLPIIWLAALLTAAGENHSANTREISRDAFDRQSSLYATLQEADSFAGPLRLFIIVLLPVTAAGTLIFSRRKLRDGTHRPMFPRYWRIFGWVSLSTTIAGFAIPGGYFAYDVLRGSQEAYENKDDESEPGKTRGP